MSMVNQLAWLVVLAGIAVGGYLGWQHLAPMFGEAKTAAAPASERPVAVETVLAERREIETAVEAVGSTRALRTVEIAPAADGRVTEVRFTAGKLVNPGDVLLTLDDDIQRADLVEAEARLKDAKSTLERSEALRRTNAVAQATVDSLTAQVAIAQAERDRAVRRLRDRVVTAPFSGVVGYSTVEIGTRVEVGDPLAVLDDLSAVEVEFSLPEGLFGAVARGTPVVAGSAAFPTRTFRGKIVSIDSRIDQASRSFRARAVIANDDRILPAGMFMHLTVILDAATALVVPEEAIVVDGSRAFLFIVTKRDDGERAERRMVQVGRRSFGAAEIVDGVAAGDAVVVRGVQKVRDGALVKSRRREPDAPRPVAGP